MVTKIGTVNFISGVVKAVNVLGEERILEINDRVHKDELVVTENVSRVTIMFDDGQSTLMLTSNDTALLDKDLYDPGFIPEVAKAENSANIEDIKRALEDDPNYDPTQVLEATAANNGTDSESLGDTLIIEHEFLSVDFSFLDSPSELDVDEGAPEADSVRVEALLINLEEDLLLVEDDLELMQEEPVEVAEGESIEITAETIVLARESIFFDEDTENAEPSIEQMLIENFGTQGESRDYSTSKVSVSETDAMKYTIPVSILVDDTGYDSFIDDTESDF